jgi:hypothetical protein
VTVDCPVSIAPSLMYWFDTLLAKRAVSTKAMSITPLGPVFCSRRIGMASVLETQLDIPIAK